MSFYVTHCPPAAAEGADDWNVYSNYEERKMDETFDGEMEFNEGYDEEGQLRPLDYFFPRG